MVVIFAPCIRCDLGGCRALAGCRKVVYQQGDHRSSPGHQFGGVYTQIKMIFHVTHLTVHSLVQPLFKATCIFVEWYGLGYATERKSKLTGLFFYQLCMVRRLLQVRLLLFAITSELAID